MSTIIPKTLLGPDTIERPGEVRKSPAEALGACLKYTMQNDPTFYLFSPDETTSNKLDAVYDVSARAWAMPKESWDLPESESGRIVELLSENALFAAMSGHVLGSKEPAMMTSYEAFFPIISSQLAQTIKFFKQSEAVSWQTPYPAINLLSTSTCWRQDHNGFSHQSPALISALLDNPGSHANCLFPVDATAAAAAFNYMLTSVNVVNLTTFNKTEEPLWIDSAHAKYQYEHGASIFGFASDDNPDYIFTAAGDISTRESLRALEILRQDFPERRFRFVGINALSYNAIGLCTAKMSPQKFSELFTDDKPIIANFHGYPGTLKSILNNYAHPLRSSVHGFIEEGSTTTPLEMLRRNAASRFDLCIDVARRENRPDLIAKYSTILQENARYARAHGEDRPEFQPL